MGVGVAHAAAEEDHGIVEEGAIGVGLGFHLFEETGEVNHLVQFEDEEVFDLVFFFAVVGKTVVAGIDTEVAGFEVAANFEGSNAGGMGLQSQEDEIVEKREIVWHVGVDRLFDGSLGLVDVRPLFLEFQLFLYMANGGKVFIEFFLIGFAQFALQGFGVTLYGIQN